MAESQPSLQDQVDALTMQVQEQEVEIALIKRALLSLGSSQLAGGSPGPAVYLAWHDEQLAPKSPGTGNSDLNPLDPKTQPQSGSTTDGGSEKAPLAGAQGGSSPQSDSPAPTTGQADTSGAGTQPPAPGPVAKPAVLPPGVTGK